jgi:hypothetical protein
MLKKRYVLIAAILAVAGAVGLNFLNAHLMIRLAGL